MSALRIKKKTKVKFMEKSMRHSLSKNVFRAQHTKKKNNNHKPIIQTNIFKYFFKKFKMRFSLNTYIPLHYR